jgi:hypothetical protein
MHNQANERKSLMKIIAPESAPADLWWEVCEGLSFRLLIYIYMDIE